MSSVPISKCLKRIYVPLATILLSVGFGGWLARSVSQFNANTAVQGAQVQFVRPELATELEGNGLNEWQTRLVRSVVSPDAPVERHGTVVLYVGNSQVTAIADRKPGDLCSPQWLQLFVTEGGSRRLAVHAASAGGMVLPEILVKVVATREQYPSTRIVILSLHLDEFRELSIRDEIAEVAASPSVNNALLSLVVANPDLTAAATGLAPVLEHGGSHATTDGSVKPAANNTSFATALEDKLQAKADQSWLLFRNREKLVGASITDFVQVRNKIFGLNSSNVRLIRDPVFKANVEVLELLLRYARSRDMHVILYLAPVRREQFQLVSGADLRKLRATFPQLCHNYGVGCANYLDAVLDEHWSIYRGRAAAGQPDYAHFQGAAHRLVAERLVADFGKDMSRWAEEGLQK